MKFCISTAVTHPAVSSWSTRRASHCCSDKTDTCGLSVKELTDAHTPHTLITKKLTMAQGERVLLHSHCSWESSVTELRLTLRDGSYPAGYEQKPHSFRIPWLLCSPPPSSEQMSWWNLLSPLEVRERTTRLRKVPIRWVRVHIVAAAAVSERLTFMFSQLQATHARIREEASWRRINAIQYKWL